MARVFDPRIFQTNVFQGVPAQADGTRTVIDTVTYSQHPINCMMGGNKSLLGDWRYDNEYYVPPRGERTTRNATVGSTSRADFIKGLKL